MRIKSSLKKLPLIIVILSILFSTPVFAGNSEATMNLVLEYDDIEKYVLQENLQLKSCKAAIDKLKSKIDDTEEESEEAEDSLYGLIYSINGVMNTLDSIIKRGNPADPNPVEPDTVAIAQTVRFSLSITQETLYSQIELLEDSTDDLSDQLDLSEWGYEQAKKTLISTAKNLFILNHQLTYNLKQLEITRIQLSDQLELMNKNVELGLATQLSTLDLQASVFELDASYAALVHKQAFLLLQMKGLLGLTYRDTLLLGELPKIDIYLVDSIKYDKDIDNAVKNAMSKKVKEAELKNSSITGNRKKYELLIKENDIVLNFTKKYYSLLEARDSLRINESKLNTFKLKLAQAQNNYDKGLISQMELDSLRYDYENQELKVRSDGALLFSEIESYMAMKNGAL